MYVDGHYTRARGGRPVNFGNKIVVRHVRHELCPSKFFHTFTSTQTILPVFADLRSAAASLHATGCLFFAGPGRQNEKHADSGGVFPGHHHQAQADGVRHLGGVSAVGGLQSEWLL